jgi:magnesium-dependent phosphatase 1
MAALISFPNRAFSSQLKHIICSILLFADIVGGFQNSCSAKSSRSFANNPLALMGSFPALIVFDLDNTIWTPELYQLRKHERDGTTPIAGKDVKLFAGSEIIIDTIRRRGYPTGTKFAVASRTKSVAWAHDLLDQFGLRELLDYVEVFPGNKRAHFSKLKEASGIDYNQMLFFDDARDGKFGNCEPVSELGVMAVHCPDGLRDYKIFETAIARFEKWDKSTKTIVEWDGSTSNPTLIPLRQVGVVKTANLDKGYGFIKYGDSKTKDVFFHFNNLSDGSTPEVGDKVTFVLQRNPRNGKNYASDLTLESAKTNGISMRAFSMNLPFAALLANGYKTLETRNGTMFVPYPKGTQMLLHVGQRIYPDSDKHIMVMKSGGLSDEEIEKLKSLPKGFGKGMVIAICELGNTYETTTAERSIPDFERKVAAFGSDSGRMVTHIKRVAYLKRPVQVSGQGGIFKTEIDPILLPDGWEPESSDHINSPAGMLRSSNPIYSISG